MADITKENLIYVLRERKVNENKDKKIARY